MLLEIFEGIGYNLETDLDMLLINLKKKYSGDLGVKKISIASKTDVQKHKDVVKKLRDEGLDVLPIIKLDGKIVDQHKLEELLYRKLG